MSAPTDQGNGAVPTGAGHMVLLSLSALGMGVSTVTHSFTQDMRNRTDAAAVIAPVIVPAVQPVLHVVLMSRQIAGKAVMLLIGRDLHCTGKTI